MHMTRYKAWLGLLVFVASQGPLWSAGGERGAASRSSGRSATTSMWATSTPRPASCSETQGPLESEMRPVMTSVPVTTIPARITP